jgi:WS/DGAT/MGAT family acyltransferase
MNREPMGHADAAWLRMDSPTNLMVVNSILWFDDPVDMDALRSILAERLVARFRRFRQRVVEEHGTWWEDDPDFDLSRHVHLVEPRGPRERRDLEDFVASYLIVPLDRERPLWDLYVLDDYYGGTALYFRMHHCIADGIALTRVLLSLTDGGRDPVGVTPAEPSESADSVGHRSALGAVTSAASAVVREAVEVATRPRHLVDLAATGATDAKALAKLVLLPPDTHYWQRRTGPDKQVAWSSPLPLARVKRAAHKAGVTINDVLLAAVAGALRAGRVREGAPVEDFRAIVPFNLRPLDEPLPSGLGNAFGLVYLDLPVELASPAERVAEMSRRMDRIKSSAEGVVSYGILDVIGQGPTVVERAAIEVFSSKGSAVMTNVVGPRDPVTLGGTTLRGTIGWAPTSGSIGLSVSIFSYHGEVVIGLCSDRLQVADVHVLLADIEAEVQKLVGRAPAGSRSGS